MQRRVSVLEMPIEVIDLLPVEPKELGKLARSYPL
jgi:hypothetical protein